jgi:hypothetical protein
MLKGKRTKIVGYLMIAVALCGVAIDALDGGGFVIGGHVKELTLALEGAGFVFLRKALEALQ